MSFANEGEPTHNPENNLPLFSVGQVVGTPPALEAIKLAGHDPLDYLLRHMTGDWGDLDEEDIQANKDAVAHGTRVFSAYNLPTKAKIWIITEWNRSSTTILLPEEY